MKKIALFLITSIISSSAVCHGVLIACFPGLDELIHEADAIVILRVDSHLSNYWNSNSYRVYECYIHQTLKGEIPINQRVRLQLLDTHGSSVSPFADGSTHLVFLVKKQTPNEQADYGNLIIQGANILVAPFDKEKMPDGKTVKEKIQSLLTRTLEYNKKQYDKEQAFLHKMLGKTRTVPAIPREVRDYLIKELGLSSTGNLALVGSYKLTENSKFGQKGDQIIHVIQQDLFGGRLFWSCLVNLTGNKIQILYRAGEPDKFGVIKTIRVLQKTQSGASSPPV